MLVTLLPFGILCLHWFMLSLRLLIVDCKKLSFYSRAWECIPSDRVVAFSAGCSNALVGQTDGSAERRQGCVGDMPHSRPESGRSGSRAIGVHRRRHHEWCGSFSLRP